MKYKEIALKIIIDFFIISTGISIPVYYHTYKHNNKTMS